MLDPDATESASSTTPESSDAPASPAPRRRRAARPAGPPAPLTGSDSTAEATQPPAETAGDPEPPAAEPPAKAPRRTRTRTPKAAAPEAETAEPPAPVAEETKPASAPRRRTRKTAASGAEAPLEAATEPAAEPAAVEAPAEATVPDSPAEPAAPRRRARARSTRPVAAPDPSPADATPAPEDPAASGDAADDGLDPVGAALKATIAERQPRKRSRSRAAAVSDATAETGDEVAQALAELTAAVAPAATDVEETVPTAAPAVEDETADDQVAADQVAAVADADEETDEDTDDEIAGEAGVTDLDEVAAALAAAALERRDRKTESSEDDEDGERPSGPSADEVLESLADAISLDAHDVDDDEAHSDDEDADQEPATGTTGRRRRRRGGRRRRRGGGDAAAAEDEEPAASEDGATETDSAAGGTDSDETDSDESEETSGTRRRRRRRRRSEAGDSGPDGGRVRTTAEAADEVTGISGSTRMEAKRQRRKEGRAAGRRRSPMLSEAEFLARRESVKRQMLIRQRPEYTQLAVLEDDMLVEHYVDRPSATSLIGNIYLGRVQNVLPSMEAAFIDIGRARNAVLYAGEVDWDSFGAEGESKKIEKVFKSGQSVLVQATKDPIGAKGARLTSHISLPGRFIVYSPGGHLSGISRKLPVAERERLKSLLGQHISDEASFIVRTAAEGAGEDDLVRDVHRLQAQWEIIEKKASRGPAPQLLYAEPDLTLRIVRDLFTEDFSEVVIDGTGDADDAFDAVDAYVRHVAPNLADRVRRWDGENGAIFAKNRVDEQIAKALERKVFLPSGGSLIIDRTEAMTVIDVNTGKFTGSGGNLEATVTSNNLEAAEEIVRQLRLRDVGGIIVIDFIDMVLPSNRELLLRRLVECLGRDRTRHQVSEVTSLGLVQMTRKRIGTGLAEAFTVQCETCHGRGYHRHDQPIADQTPADGGERHKGHKGQGKQGKGHKDGGRKDGKGRKEQQGNGSGVKTAEAAALPV
ncbi:Rne/Rng family ribonuclease [Propionicicella superfundia]|uniref:Rne/Rng family ribonuclease n=1 Tax=Propionicicella superfundia TaxID=348582 RepID=UPI0004223ECD|nr:Rne/Rng family ribonuclease [Propionicicella superfundia]